MTKRSFSDLMQAFGEPTPEQKEEMFKRQFPYADIPIEGRAKEAWDIVNNEMFPLMEQIKRIEVRLSLLGVKMNYIVDNDTVYASPAIKLSNLRKALGRAEEIDQEYADMEKAKGEPKQ